MKKTLRVLAVVAATLTMLTTATGAALASTNSPQAHAVAQAPQLAPDEPPGATPIPIDPNTVPISVSGPSPVAGCDQFSICLWKNANLSPPLWQNSYFGAAHNQWLAVGSSLNNAGSTLLNYRDTSTEVAQFAGGGGFQACIPANTGYANLSRWNWPGSTTTMNDSITSYKFDTVSLC